MKERLKRLPEEIEKTKDAELKKVIYDYVKPRRRNILKQKIKKEIFSIPLKPPYKKMLRFLWSGKPKSIMELKNEIDREDIKSFVYRLNKIITPKAKVRHCRDLGQPKHYRFIIHDGKFR